jgi:hypothetical protein
MDVATRRGWLVLVALVLAIFASTLPPAQGLQPIPSFSDPLSLASAQLIPPREKINQIDGNWDSDFYVSQIFVILS